MKHTAVIGTGTIGLMLGGLLTRGGWDVTIVSMFRRGVAERLAREGLTIRFNDQVWPVAVRSVYVDDLPADEKYDILFVTGRSNDTGAIIEAMKNHLSEEGFVTSLQNGLNDEAVAAVVGWERVVPCVCFAGGQCPKPNYVVTHDGRFVLGEIDGSVTPRLTELTEMLSCVKPVEVSSDILAERWKKMAEVSITVPSATITGYSLFDHYEDRDMQKAFGLLAAEIWDVRAAAGIRPYPIMGLTGEQWRLLAQHEDSELTKRFLSAAHKPAPKRPAPDGSLPVLVQTDAYTADIRQGRELEIGYTDGYILRKGKSQGIPVAHLEKLVSMVYEIQQGKRSASPENLNELFNI